MKSPIEKMKKNCLLILPRSIFPVIGGYAIKNKELIKILHDKYNLSLVVISDHKPDKEEEDFYAHHSASFRIFVYPKYRYWLNALRALMTKEPIQVGYFYFSAVQKYIDSILPKQDIVIGALIRAMKYIKKDSAYKRVFDMVDSIAINYQNSMDKVKSKFWKLLYSIEKDRLFASEKQNIIDSDVTFLFNWKETEYWSKYGNVRLLPHGVNDRLATYDKVDDTYSNAVAFIGKMDYQPNIDAVLWYLKNVHSKIGDKIPFYIVGAAPTKEVINEAAKYSNVTVTGFVDDPFLIIKSAMAVVAPMQTGAGIQNKVLEAMGLGKPVITTTLSAFPIKGAENGRELLIADTPEEFINTIKFIQANPKDRDRIGKNAYEFIWQHHTWSRYGEEYIKGIEQKL